MNIKLLCSKRERGLTCFAFNITYYFSQIFQVRALDTLLCLFFFFLHRSNRRNPVKQYQLHNKLVKPIQKLGQINIIQTHSYLSIQNFTQLEQDEVLHTVILINKLLKVYQPTQVSTQTSNLINQQLSQKLKLLRNNKFNHLTKILTLSQVWAQTPLYFINKKNLYK